MRKITMMLILLALSIAPLACGEADLPLDNNPPNTNDTNPPVDTDPTPSPSPSPSPTPGDDDDSDGPQYYPAPHWELCIIGEPGCGYTFELAD